MEYYEDEIFFEKVEKEEFKCPICKYYLVLIFSQGIEMHGLSAYKLYLCIKCNKLFNLRKRCKKCKVEGKYEWYYMRCNNCYEKEKKGV